MAEWEAEVEERMKVDEHFLSTQEGRETLSTVKLTQDHIKPLYRLLKHRRLPSDIESALWIMTKAMQARNYREAGDIYVRVAIGNAPWPIGVTMVGIHERRRDGHWVPPLPPFLLSGSSAWLAPMRSLHCHTLLLVLTALWWSFRALSCSPAARARRFRRRPRRT